MKKFELKGVVAIARGKCREYNIELLYDEKFKTKIKVDCEETGEFAEVMYYGVNRKMLLDMIYNVINSFFDHVHYVLLVDKNLNVVG